MLYYKFVAYNSGFGNNKRAIFDQFTWKDSLSESIHKENIDIKLIPLDVLLILKIFLDDNIGFYNTIRRAVDTELETQERKNQFNILIDKKQRNDNEFAKSQREKSNFDSKINQIVQDTEGKQKIKLLKLLKDTLKENCKISEHIIDSIDFGQILNEYSEYVAGLAIRNVRYNSINSELDKLYKQFSKLDQIENKLIEKFCDKNLYHICINIYKKTGIQDEINRIKKFLIDRVTNYFYDDLEIVYDDVDFDKEATDIFREYGSLENYIETLTSNSTENNNFNSKIFKQITQHARNIKKQRNRYVGQTEIENRYAQHIRDVAEMTRAANNLRSGH